MFSGPSAVAVLAQRCPTSLRLAMDVESFVRDLVETSARSGPRAAWHKHLGRITFVWSLEFCWTFRCIPWILVRSARWIKHKCSFRCTAMVIATQWVLYIYMVGTTPEIYIFSNFQSLQTHKSWVLCLLTQTVVPADVSPTDGMHQCYNTGNSFL